MKNATQITPNTNNISASLLTVSPLLLRRLTSVSQALQ